MSLEAGAEALAGRVLRLRSSLLTEEAAKLSLVLPFFRDVLGYDYTEPSEITPEYRPGPGPSARVDFAVLPFPSPFLIGECKGVSNTLASYETRCQLGRYFSEFGAAFGFMTNGIRYRFYSDLRESGVMDSSPFFQVDFSCLDSGGLEGLRVFAKGSNADAAREWAMGRGGVSGRFQDGDRGAFERDALAVLRAVVFPVGDAGAVHMEAHSDSTNFYHWPGLRGDRKRLCRLDFNRRGGVVLRLYGAGGNEDLVASPVIGSAAELGLYADTIAGVVGDG